MSFSLSNIFRRRKREASSTPTEKGQALLGILRTHDDHGALSSWMAENFHRIEALIGDGASLKETNFAGYTALSLAIDRGLEKVALHIAAQEGVDVNHKTSFGVTPLMLAAEHLGGDDLVKALLARNADVHAKTAKGDTALHYAAINANKDAALALIAAGAALDARGEHENTPIMNAVCYARYDFAIMLSDQGARCDLVNDVGYTILDMMPNRKGTEEYALFSGRIEKQRRAAQETRQERDLRDLNAEILIEEPAQEARPLRFKPKGQTP